MRPDSCSWNISKEDFKKADERAEKEAEVALECIQTKFIIRFLEIRIRQHLSYFPNRSSAVKTLINVAADILKALHNFDH